MHENSPAYDSARALRRKSECRKVSLFDLNARVESRCCYGLSCRVNDRRRKIHSDDRIAPFGQQERLRSRTAACIKNRGCARRAEDLRDVIKRHAEKRRIFRSPEVPRPGVVNFHALERSLWFASCFIIDRQWRTLPEM